MIELKNLSKSYRDQLVLTQLNQTFPSGSITGLLGQNGAGKSTFIRCLSGEEPFDGSALFQHQDLRHYHRNNP